MIYQTKHIILSRLLLLALILPPLWQLEHAFDNNHGIIYHQNTDTIHTVYDNSCAPLHKHFQFFSIFNGFFFQSIKIDFPVLNNSILPSKPYVYTVCVIALRAPPFIA